MNLIPPCCFAAGFYFCLETSAAPIMCYKYCRESPPTSDITDLSRVEMLERWCALKWAFKSERPGSNSRGRSLSAFRFLTCDASVWVLWEQLNTLTCDQYMHLLEFSSGKLVSVPERENSYCESMNRNIHSSVFIHTCCQGRLSVTVAWVSGWISHWMDGERVMLST